MVREGSSARWGQIVPIGIRFLDEIELPLPLPPLDARFALDSIGVEGEFLEPDEPGNIVFLHEGRAASFAMGLNTGWKIGRDPGVQRAVPFILARM